MMSEEKKTAKLKDEELKQVAGGAYDPNTGKGLAVGDLLRNNIDLFQMYYRITNVNTSYYDVKSLIKKGFYAEGTAVFMQISFNALVRRDFIPSSDPGDLVDVTSASYPEIEQ